MLGYQGYPLSKLGDLPVYGTFVRVEEIKQNVRITLGRIVCHLERGHHYSEYK